MEGSDLDVFARKARRDCITAITLETVVKRWTWEMHQRRVLERVKLVDAMQSGHAELITTTMTNIAYWEGGKWVESSRVNSIQAIPIWHYPNLTLTYPNYPNANLSYILKWSYPLSILTLTYSQLYLY